MATNKYLIIDGTSYDIHLIDVKRRADMLDAQAYRTEDGKLHRKVIGVYYNYDVTVGVEWDTDKYDKLFEVLAEPVAYHSVQLPGESKAQNRYISGVEDGIIRVTDDGVLYKDLSFKVTCTDPTKKSTRRTTI